MTHEDIAAEYDKLADALAATADPSNNWDTEAALKFRVEAQRHRWLGRENSLRALDVESAVRSREQVAEFHQRNVVAWERIAVALEKIAGKP